MILHAILALVRPPKVFGNVIKNALSRLTSNEILTKVDNLKVELNSSGIDPWGMDPSAIKSVAGILYQLYSKYFRVEVEGVENLPDGRALLVANHGGQVPIDALMVTSSLIFDKPEPRLARSLFDKWVPSLPFVGSIYSQMGSVVGSPKNCIDLLNHGEYVLVFPEGTKGVGKTIFERYQLQRFGNGFLHMAIETNTPIVPVAVIGAEEAIPSLARLEGIGKKLGAPYIPLTPFGLVPLPTKMTIRFGKPIEVKAGENGLKESEIERKKIEIRDALQSEINKGLEIRGDQIFTKAAK